MPPPPPVCVYPGKIKETEKDEKTKESISLFVKLPNVRGFKSAQWASKKGAHHKFNGRQSRL